MIGQARIQFRALLMNPVFLSIVFSWLSAQFIKTMIKLLAGRIRNIKELVTLLLWKTGGMPSSHSSLVASMCTAIGFHNGMNSDIFVLSLAFALVVIRDALGVRRSSGIQAKVLNEIGTALQDKELISFSPVKEVQGHKPIEVIMGCFLGFFIGLAFSIL